MTTGGIQILHKGFPITDGLQHAVRIEKAGEIDVRSGRVRIPVFTAWTHKEFAIEVYF